MRIDANKGIHDVFVALKKEINSLIKEMKPPKRKAVEKRLAKAVGEKDKENVKAKPKQDGKAAIEEKPKGSEKAKAKKEAEVDKNAKPAHKPAEVSDKETGTKDRA